MNDYQNTSIPESDSSADLYKNNNGREIENILKLGGENKLKQQKMPSPLTTFNCGELNNNTNETKSSGQMTAEDIRIREIEAAHTPPSEGIKEIPIPEVQEDATEPTSSSSVATSQLMAAAFAHLMAKQYEQQGMQDNDRQIHQQQEILQQNENRIRQREREVAAELLSKHLQQHGALLQQLKQLSTIQGANAATFLPQKTQTQALGNDSFNPTPMLATYSTNSLDIEKDRNLLSSSTLAVLEHHSRGLTSNQSVRRSNNSVENFSNNSILTSANLQQLLLASSLLLRQQQAKSVTSESMPTNVLHSGEVPTLQQFSGLHQIQQQRTGLNTSDSSTGRILENIFVNPSIVDKFATQMFTPRFQQQLPQISPLAIAELLRQRTFQQQPKQQVVSPPPPLVTYRRVGRPPKHPSTVFQQLPSLLIPNEAIQSHNQQLYNPTQKRPPLCPGRRVPTSADPCQTIVTFLLAYNVREELDWFIQTVIEDGARPTQCITIPRTLDGRLQVCVNPYHYERVIPIAVGKCGFGADSDESSPISTNGSCCASSSSTGSGGKQEICQSNHTVPPKNLYTSPISRDMVSSSALLASPMKKLSPLGADASLNLTSHPLANLNRGLLIPMPFSVQQQQIAQKLLDRKRSICCDTPQQLTTSTVADGFNSESNVIDDNVKKPRLNVVSHASEEKTTGALPTVTSLAPDTPRLTFSYHEWGNLVLPRRSFYGSAVHCGTRDAGDAKEFFQIGCGKLLIPEEGSATELSPLKSQQLLDARKQIGLGLVLESNDDGELFLTSYARRPLLVQSHYLDREAMRSAMDVERIKHTIFPKATIKIFDLWQSFRLMCQLRLHKIRNSTADHLVGIGQDSFTFLNHLCNVRISFGVQHSHNFFDESDGCDLLESSPCSMEIHMGRSVLHELINLIFLFRSKRILEKLIERPELAHRFSTSNVGARTGRNLVDVGIKA
uniref:MH2 domain-containing protein n=1 Tax=Meloidogyne hapla TaxID=6305 RepID=A0A1I8BHY9_MELHA